MAEFKYGRDIERYTIVEYDGDFDAGTARDYTFPPPGELIGEREVNDEDRAAKAERDAELSDAAADADRLTGISAHRFALASAREILLGYRYGAPGTPSFPSVLSPVQTAVLEYRDGGIQDAECDTHIMWINARVNEINASALYGAGVLK